MEINDFDQENTSSQITPRIRKIQALNSQRRTNLKETEFKFKPATIPVLVKPMYDNHNTPEIVNKLSFRQKHRK